MIYCDLLAIPINVGHLFLWAPYPSTWKSLLVTQHSSNLPLSEHHSHSPGPFSLFAPPELGFKIWPLTSVHPPHPFFTKVGQLHFCSLVLIASAPSVWEQPFIMFLFDFPPLVYVGNPYSANVSWTVRKAWPFHCSHLLSFSNSQCEEVRNQDLRIPWVNAKTQSSKQKHKGNYYFKSTKNGNTFF